MIIYGGSLSHVGTPKIINSNGNVHEINHPAIQVPPVIRKPPNITTEAIHRLT